jgi:hypothetical protein
MLGVSRTLILSSSHEALVVGIRNNYNPLNAMRRIHTIYVQEKKEKKKNKGKASNVVVVVVVGAGASMRVVAKYVLHASRKENPPQNKFSKSSLLDWLLAWSRVDSDQRQNHTIHPLLTLLPEVIVPTGEWDVLPSRLSASSRREATHKLSSTRRAEVPSG